MDYAAAYDAMRDFAVAECHRSDPAQHIMDEITISPRLHRWLRRNHPSHFDVAREDGFVTTYGSLWSRFAVYIDPMWHVNPEYGFITCSPDPSAVALGLVSASAFHLSPHDLFLPRSTIRSVFREVDRDYFWGWHTSNRRHIVKNDYREDPGRVHKANYLAMIVLGFNIRNPDLEMEFRLKFL